MSTLTFRNIASGVRRGLWPSDIFPTFNIHRYAAAFNSSKGHIQRLSHCQVYCKKKKKEGGGGSKVLWLNRHTNIL